MRSFILLKYIIKSNKSVLYLKYSKNIIQSSNFFLLRKLSLINIKKDYEISIFYNGYSYEKNECLYLKKEFNWTEPQIVHNNKKLFFYKLLFTYHFLQSTKYLKNNNKLNDNNTPPIISVNQWAPEINLNNGSIIKRVYPDEIEEYLQKGWKLGGLKRKWVE